MDILKPFRSCFLCKKRDDLKRAADINVTEFTKFYYYHEDCLIYAMKNPTTIGHTKVDIALGIIRIKKEEEEEFRYKKEKMKTAILNLKKETTELFINRITRAT